MQQEGETATAASAPDFVQENSLVLKSKDSGGGLDESAKSNPDPAIPNGDHRPTNGDGNSCEDLDVNNIIANTDKEPEAKEQDNFQDQNSFQSDPEKSAFMAPGKVEEFVMPSSQSEQENHVAQHHHQQQKPNQ